MLMSIKKSSGVGLIELMIAIAILGILAALAMPSYNTWIQNTQIRTAAESIQSGIQMARAEAVKQNASVQFDLRGDNSAWTVCVRPAAPGSCPDPDDATTIQSRNIAEGSSANISVAASDGGPYVFSPLGVMTSPAPTAANGLVSLDVNNTSLSSADSRDLRIVIGVGGSAKMCDPVLDVDGTDPRRCPAAE